jgi:hypothetical protein
MSADIDPAHFGAAKIDALHDSGFHWNDELDLWVNPEKRLAMSAFATHESSVARLLEFAAKPASESVEDSVYDGARSWRAGAAHCGSAAALPPALLTEQNQARSTKGRE